MSALPSITVTPWQATQAYAGVSAGAAEGAVGGAAGDPNAFGATLARALGGVFEAGERAETGATQAIAGHGSLTDVVTAVSKAELALQTTVAVRDRVVQAYQDIMKMPI